MKQFLNVFTALICSVLTVILYMLVVSFLSTVMCRGLISEKGIKNIMNEVDVLELPATGILASDQLDNATIKDVIVNKASEHNVSEVLVLQVLESPKFNQIASEFITDYSNYMLEGGTKSQVDMEDLNELILSSRDLVKKQTGYVIPDSQVAELSKVATEFADEINNSVPTKEEVAGQSTLASQTLDLIYSDWFIFLSICSIIFILLAIMLLRFNVIAPLIWGGIAFISAGSTLTLIAVLKTFIVNLVNQTEGVYTNIFQAISSGLFKNIYFYGIGTLVLGIIMVIIHSILKKKTEA